MSDDAENDKPDSDKPNMYMSYRGLGYTSMFGGVPLFLALGLLGGVVVCTIIILTGHPVVALFLFVAIMGVYFFFKVLCENNNKAPALLKLKIRGLLNRLKHGKIRKVDYGVESNEQRKKFRKQFKSLFAAR